MQRKYDFIINFNIPAGNLFDERYRSIVSFFIFCSWVVNSWFRACGVFRPMQVKILFISVNGANKNWRFFSIAKTIRYYFAETNPAMADDLMNLSTCVNDEASQALPVGIVQGCPAAYLESVLQVSVFIGDFQ